MKQKIEWYKELLELEPGSRVYFPLARLLAADGQLPEAISTLQSGVNRHPDHLESRLLLIELLYIEQNMKSVHKQINELDKMLQKYPVFWAAWSETLANTPSMQDASLALKFFSMALQGKKISWSEIIEKGINSVSEPTATSKYSYQLEEEKVFHQPIKPVVKHNVEPEDVVNESSLAKSTKDKGGNGLDTSVSEDSKNKFEVSKQNKSSALISSSTENLPVTEEDDNSEEPFSLRTKSMADILAEQGDIDSALEIYQELLDSSDSEDKESLKSSIKKLLDLKENQLNHGNAQVEPEKTEELDRVASLLENLAQRFEKRGQ